jgi:predicted alpha/beta-hydrolase family hydrolase
LIVQGSRDRFGGRAEVEKYVLSSRVQIAWIEGGDHSFRAHAGSGRTDQQNLAAVIEVVRLFLATLPH